MGMPSVYELLIVLLIVALIFGTKKLRGMGEDLGGGLKGFLRAFRGNDGDTLDVSRDASDTVNDKDVDSSEKTVSDNKS